MKKILLSFGLCFLCSALYAQDDADIKARANAKTIEVNLRPLDVSPISISQLRFRHFIKDDLAFRLGLNVRYENNKPAEDQVQKRFDISARPGLEWHFEGTKRLSPYFGIEAEIAGRTASFEDGSNNASISQINGAWTSGGSNQGYFRWGTNAILGADFYIARYLYLGAEIGFGFEHSLYTDIEIEYTPNTGANNQTISGGSGFVFGPNYLGAFRLGFVF